MLYLYAQLLQPRQVHICSDIQAGLIPGLSLTLDSDRNKASPSDNDWIKLLRSG